MAPHYPLPRVIGVELYDNDAVVLRADRPGQRDPPPRGDVTVFSWKSRKRLAFIAANTPVKFTSMCTLTYPREWPTDGRTVKRHLNTFLTALRRRCPNVEYLWFIEFQRRGAPHFHILIRGLRVNRDTQYWTSLHWYTICDTGDERHLRAGVRLERIRVPNGAARYAVKYAYKMKQKRVPDGYQNVGRFWGHSSNVKPQPNATIQCTEDDIVAALEYGKWPWLRSDTIEYNTLYGAADTLTKWQAEVTLVPSTSDK
jgi:hypothetical protein